MQPRRCGLIDLVRRVESDLLLPFTNKPLTFRHVKDTSPAVSLHVLALTECDVFHFHESRGLTQAIGSLVTPELIIPESYSSGILRSIRLFLNPDNLSVAK